MNPNKRLIFGCMGLGGGWNHNPITNEDRKAGDIAIEAALEAGITTFDHANIYTFGKAEQVFGDYLKRNPSLRDKINIQSKAGIIINSSLRGSNIYNSSKSYLEQQLESILERLSTDYLDTFLIHRPDPFTSFAELGDTLSDIYEKGLAKQIGVSNMSQFQINALQSQMDIRIISNQLQFSLGHSQLLDQGVLFNTNGNSAHSTEGMLEYAQVNQLEIQAWRSLDQGIFTMDDASIKAPHVVETRDLIKKLALKYNTHPVSIQLAWLLSLPYTISPIIGTTNPERIKHCTEAENIVLERDDWYALWISARGNSLP